MIKKPSIDIPDKLNMMGLFKQGLDTIVKLAEKDDEQLGKSHQDELLSMITKHLLKVIVSEKPVDLEIKEAIHYLLDEEARLKMSPNEWVEILKEALLKIEVQYFTNENSYLADVIMLYQDENLAGQKKPKAVKLRSAFSYDELPQDLRNDIFTASSQQQVFSYELYVKEQ